MNYICKDVGTHTCADDAFVESAMRFPEESLEPCGDLSDIAMLLYTSGSTVKPKCIVFDNDCVLHSIARNIIEVELDESVIYGSTAIFRFGMA